MDEINIESEDLDDLPESPAPAPVVAGELLVIEAIDPKDDLQGVARSSVTQITDVLVQTPEQRETAALEGLQPREGYW